MLTAKQIAANRLKCLKRGIYSGHRIMFDETAQDPAELRDQKTTPYPTWRVLADTFIHNQGRLRGTRPNYHLARVAAGHAQPSKPPAGPRTLPQKPSQPKQSKTTSTSLASFRQNSANPRPSRNAAARCWPEHLAKSSLLGLCVSASKNPRFWNQPPPEPEPYIPESPKFATPRNLPYQSFP
jgi:hypothetical protein